MTILKQIGEGAFFLGVFLALWIISDQVDQSGRLADPVKFFYIWSGWLSFAALLGGLLFRKMGRFLGHCALVFALWHTLIFIVFDFGLNWDLMGMEILQKPYVDIGILALLLMLILGGFSFFGTFFRSLVWVVFACILLSLAHIVMIQKVLNLFYWLMIVGVIGVLMYKVFSFVKRLNRPFKA